MEVMKEASTKAKKHKKQSKLAVSQAVKMADRDKSTSELLQLPDTRFLNKTISKDNMSPGWKSSEIDEMKSSLMEMQSRIKEIKDEYEMSKNKTVDIIDTQDEGTTEMRSRIRYSSPTRRSIQSSPSHGKTSGKKGKSKSPPRKVKKKSKKVVSLDQIGIALSRIERKSKQETGCQSVSDLTLRPGEQDIVEEEEKAVDQFSIEVTLEKEGKEEIVSWYDAEVYHPMENHRPSPDLPRDQLNGDEDNAMVKPNHSQSPNKSSIHQGKLSLALPVVHLHPKEHGLIGSGVHSMQSFSRILQRNGTEKSTEFCGEVLSAKDYLSKFLQSNHTPLQLLSRPKQTQTRMKPGHSRDMSMTASGDASGFPFNCYFPPTRHSVPVSLRRKTALSDLSILHAEDDGLGKVLTPTESSSGSELFSVKQNPIINRFVERAKTQSAKYRLCKHSGTTTSTLSPDTSKAHLIYRMDITPVEKPEYEKPSEERGRIGRQTQTLITPEHVSLPPEGTTEDIGSNIVLPKLPERELEEMQSKKGVSSAAKFTYYRGRYSSRYWPSSTASDSGPDTLTHNSSPGHNLAPDMKAKPLNVISIKS